jgi:excisionase family DNA binding protein
MAQITTNEAALRLGIDRSRIHQLLRAGRLPATKLGRDWLIEEADLDLVRDRKPGRAGWTDPRPMRDRT